jgi:ubiquinone/menaquinone biosynthesis C-methylase UbiE
MSDNPAPGAQAGQSVRDEARRTWGDKPAGSTFAEGIAPGTREFFETVVQRRQEHEMPWLAKHVLDQDMQARKVLEVGSGAGYDALMFLRAGAAYQGIDLTPENIDRAHRHLASCGFDAQFSVGDAEKLPVADESVDHYFSNGVLHHVNDFATCLAEAYRVLAPGGRMTIIVYHKHSLFYWLFIYAYKYLWEQRRAKSVGAILSEIEFNTVEARPLVRVYTRSSLARAVRHAGFAHVATAVEKFRKEDVPQIRGVKNLVNALPLSWCDAIGRRLGWYLICNATKPHPSSVG